MSEPVIEPSEIRYVPPEPTRTQVIHSIEIGEIVKALSLAQGQMKGAKKDTENPFFKSHYADLASDWDACRDPLSKNGLAVFQVLSQVNGRSVLITTLGHSSGQWIRSYYPIIPVKNDPQGVKSAITYARRTALEAIVGISTVEDDDGEAAQGRGEPESWREPLERAQALAAAQEGPPRGTPKPITPKKEAQAPRPETRRFKQTISTDAQEGQPFFEDTQ